MGCRPADLDRLVAIFRQGFRREPEPHCQEVVLSRSAVLVLWLAAVVGFPVHAQKAPTGELVVFNAGSLAKPFSELLAAFRERNPDVRPAQENSGSLEAARKLTELQKIPDVLAIADYSIIPKLLVPEFVTWHALFARTAMVLAYTDQSEASGEISGQNWWQVLQRPRVRWGHSDPVLDPAGYRSLMVLQLAERFYRQPGLARQLRADRRYVRPKSADLIALLQTGELDYAWEYEAVARMHGLRYLELPAEINLGDIGHARTYGEAKVRLPGALRSGADSLDFRGEPIAYALTIPKAAPHPATAAAFTHFIFSSEGQAILAANGFTLLDKPMIGGPGKPPPGVF